jgi:hypothetical protein
MELKYGSRRVFEISLFSAIVLCLGTYYMLNRNPGLAFGSLFITLWAFRGIFRYFACSNWIKVDALKLKDDDLSYVLLGWRGGASLISNHRINLEYTVEGKSYRTDIFLSHPGDENLNVYYKPSNPEIVCATKGLGWEGIVFISFFSLLILYKFFPGLFIYKLIKFIGDTLNHFKDNL